MSCVDETLDLYKAEFGDAVAAARDYLETRGVNLDIEVKSPKDIRSLVRRLDEASEWENWPK